MCPVNPLPFISVGLNRSVSSVSGSSANWSWCQARNNWLSFISCEMDERTFHKYLHTVAGLWKGNIWNIGCNVTNIGRHLSHCTKTCTLDCWDDLMALKDGDGVGWRMDIKWVWCSLQQRHLTCFNLEDGFASNSSKTHTHTHVCAHAHIPKANSAAPWLTALEMALWVALSSGPPSKWAIKLHPGDRMAPTPLAEKIYLFVCLFAWFKYLVGGNIEFLSPGQSPLIFS